MHEIQKVFLKHYADDLKINIDDTASHFNSGLTVWWSKLLLGRVAVKACGVTTL
jgi:hypothetical protein